MEKKKKKDNPGLGYVYKHELFAIVMDIRNTTIANN